MPHLLAPAVGTTAVELDGLVSVHVSSSQTVHFLNGTASAVWRLLDGTRTAQRVVVELTSTFAASASTVELEVRRLLEEWMEHGLVRVVES